MRRAPRPGRFERVALCKFWARGACEGCAYRHSFANGEERAWAAAWKPPENENHGGEKHAARHAVFGKWIAETFPAGVTKILDVAGGNGGLAWELQVVYGFEATTLDARILKPWCRRRRKILRKCQTAAPEKIQGMFGDEVILATEPDLVVGLHPDEATEAIVDAALKYGLPFAVVPCCVFAELFPARRGVSSYSKFCDYLQAKDPRHIKVDLLNIDGKRKVLYRLPGTYPPVPDLSLALPRDPAYRPHTAEEIRAVAAKVADVQLRSGQLSSYKALALMRSTWPLGAARDADKAPSRTIGLYRIIGNPLPPRHDVHQLHDNLRYLLEKEPALRRARKVFVLNRLNASLEKEVRRIVASYGHDALTIPFDLDEYRPHQMEDTYGLRPDDWGDLMHPKFNQMNANLYLMNNNGARNAALRHGIRNGWRWTMPFDGNCFFTTEQWEEVLDELDAGERRGAKYAAVPMVRTRVIDHQTDDEAPPGLSASAGPGEHQIAFHASAGLRFDPTVPYGHRPKVSMLWKLGIPGAWDAWNHDTVFRAEGACYYLGAERKVKAPSICSRTLPALDDAASKDTFASRAVVYRLPDSWPHAASSRGSSATKFSAAAAAANATASGESYDDKKKRRGLRDEAIMHKISETDTRSPPAAAGAREFVKPVFFNVFSMEAMRRECLVHKAERGERVSRWRPVRPERGVVDQHHCAQMDALARLADWKLKNRPMAVVDKAAYLRKTQRARGKEAPRAPRNATRHHFQNIGPYDWRLGELPPDVDLKRLQLMPHRRHVKTTTPSSSIFLDETFRREHASEFVKWEGHVRPDGRLWGPGSQAFDRTRAYEMMSNVTMFALAHFYTGHAKYSEKAARLVRTWFLDPATRMEPTMAFAHWSRPSNNMYGVIQLKDLAFALDALALVERSHAWTSTDAAEMRDWCRTYLADLGSSHERAAKTNHGWWFLVQYAAVARCAGAPLAIAPRVRELIRDPAYHREDGVMPHEMTRTRALHNHFFTSYALVLAWRALQNSGDAETSRILATSLESTVRLLNSAVTNATVARMLRLDDSAIFRQRRYRNGALGTLAREYAAPLCQWAFDLHFGETLDMCKRTAPVVPSQDPRLPPLPSVDLEKYYWPPLLPTAPHTGVFPFMNLMW
ncbi:hypothetical protein CTAYLR_004969 [Chrysophaeum taylorii]|uniref:Alginate lyase domain-containing protein n=1 Tax=Chrysophaeum taylorii TaxID=2483200 RepID=A0AAD7UR69_9STRA|nr:hypothetical protein CTAYLR_004969 [Chrysophaeum taylorii]